MRHASTKSRIAHVGSGSILLGLVLLAGCESETPFTSSDPERGVAATAPEGAASGGGLGPVSTADVVHLDDFTVVEGAASQLVRTPNGVNYRLSTTGLEPGHAYTLWIVIFNHPEGCEHGDPCGEMDIVNDAAKPDMMFAGGNVVGNSGQSTFGGRRSVDDFDGSANEPVDLPAYGLQDPFGAEIWLVVHDHGEKLPDYLPDMIQTIDGGCTDAGVPQPGVSSPWNDHEEPGVGAFGERGPNTCASVQLAIHRP